MNPSVTVENVVKSYGRIPALRGVSFKLVPGELVALVGHNGAGKTTLMKLILGLIRLSAGAITVLGEKPSAGAFASRRHLGYLPENVALDGGLSGHETLSFYARLKRQPLASCQTLLERVGLAQDAHRRVSTYSKGMRQRLGLAQSLIGDPRLLLLDEPTSGLDPEFRQRFYAIAAELRNRGTTVLLSSHALTELEERADRVIVMNKGLVVANGTIADLRRAARLPSRITLRVAEGFSTQRSGWLKPATSLRRINGCAVELVCPEQDKMTVIHGASAEEAGVTDIEIAPPGLDELYLHLLRTQEQPQ